MTRTVIPEQRPDAYGRVRPVRCQGGTGRCPNDAVVVVIENARQPYARRYLCAIHYVIDK